jgi:DNA-binding MarR family transcriptional regulator
MGVTTSDDELRRLGTELVVASSRLIRAMRRELADDLPLETLRLLAQIDERGPIGITQLAHAERCSQPTMSTAVRALVERGWAAREADPRDARASMVTLTAEGDAELARARAQMGTVIADWFAAAGTHKGADLRAAVDLMTSVIAQAAERSDTPR